jgi:hypothetical protein
MEESTTTETTASTGAEEAQPDTTQATDSAATTDESTTTTTKQDEGTEAVADENLDWLQKKGIDPQDPDVVTKLAKMYRDAEKAMHESNQKASELQNALSTDPPTQQQQADDPVASLQAEVQAMKLATNVNTFFTSNPDAKQYEAKMAEIVTSNPTVGTLVKAGYLNVEQLYQMAKGADGSRENDLKTQGGREALQKVADKQQGRAVTGAATNSDLAPAKDDPFLKGFNKPF